MTKQIKNIIIAAVVLVVLVASLFLVKFLPKSSSTTSSSSESSTTAIKVVNADSSKLTLVHVKSSSTEFTLKKSSGGKWSVEELGKVPTAALAQTAAESAAAITASSVVDSNASNLKAYGLASPKATLEVTASGKTETVLVGDKSPTGSGYYVCLKGTNKVYLSDSDFFSYYEYKPIQFAELSLLTVDSSSLLKLTSMTLGGTSRSPAVVMNINKSATSASESTPEYNMVSPGNYDTDPDQISTLVNQLASVTASEAVSLDMSDANLSKYGLKNPANTFSCTFNGKVYTLLFGNTETDSGTENIYVMLQGRNIIYKIATSSLSFYNWNASNLVSRLLFLDNIDTVKTLTVTIDSKSYQFNLSGTDDKLKVIYNSKTLNTSYFRNYYEDVLSNQVEDMATKPANGKVVCTVKVDYRSSSKASTTMQFTQIDDRRLFWQINGKGNFYILRTTVDKLISDTKLIAANKAVATS